MSHAHNEAIDSGLDPRRHHILIRVGKLEGLPLTAAQREVVRELKTAVNAERFGPHEQALARQIQRWIVAGEIPGLS